MKLAQPDFDETELELVRECLDSRWVGAGPMVERMEAALAARSGAGFAMCCSSGTAALHLATLALGLGPGDEMIVPAFTWVTSAHCAEYVGARPVFVDIDLATFNLDPDAVAAAITPRTRAIMAVHLFGLAAPMDEINAIARRYGIAVIEDAACAIGTTYGGQPVGALGDIACFSFHPRKVVTTGEGGAVTTSNAALAERVRSFRNHGATGLPDAEVEPHGPWTMGRFGNLGFNLRLSDLQAAVGVAQMAKLDRMLEERRALGRRYNMLLADIAEIGRPVATNNDGHTYQSYVIRIQEGGRARRNAVMAALSKADIQTRPGTHAVHRLDYYTTKYGYRTQDVPNAAVAEDTSIALPLFPGMTEAEQEHVVGIVRQALAG